MAIQRKPRQRWRLYLQEWRNARGLTQQQVADRIGLDSFQTVSRWERWAQGKATEATERKPDLDDLADLATLYGIEPEDFYHPPTQPTPNAMLRGEPEDVWNQARRLIDALRKPH
jgi:transcriptional regulator with XRE-family HTH domain